MKRTLTVAGMVIGMAVILSLGGPVRAATTSPTGSKPTAARVAAPPEPGQGWLTGRRQRLLAFRILVDVGGLMLWFGAEPARSPRLLGSVGAHRAVPAPEEEPDEPVRGIGRFARPRSAPPHRLL